MAGLDEPGRRDGYAFCKDCAWVAWGEWSYRDAYQHATDFSHDTTWREPDDGPVEPWALGLLPNPD